MAEQTIWGIHAGKTGDADQLFLKENVVALGWEDIPDLSAVPANRDAFKPLIQKAYPRKKPGAIPVDAGQLYRFLHELQARSFERGKSNLRLIDGEQLVELILQHYESFDSRYKGLLPLKRV